MSWARRTRVWGLISGHRDVVLRLLRYASVSIITVTVVTSALGVLVGLTNLPAETSSLMSNCLGIVISFELNRRWAWGGRSGRARMSQIIPFAIMNLGGVVLADVVVKAVDIIARQHHYGRVSRTFVVEAANLAAWGALWLLQFLILDRYLFKRLEVPEIAEPEPLIPRVLDSIEDEIILLVDPPRPLPAPAAVDGEHIDFS